ncbi:MAG TPA: hypothetical protein VFI96_04860 [Longimicrobiaceae bacterium]|nr:hypothetical protein [Longimicrobiaceae bacterium]
MCQTCGTRQPGRAAGPPAPRAHTAVAVSGTCPNCGYHGEGLPYFSRARNAALLVGATVLTAGAMGAGGIIYYIVRRDFRVCPRCGRSWGHFGERAIARTGAIHAAGGEPSLPSTWRESGKRGWSVALFVFAAMLTIAGIAGEAIVPILFAAVCAVGGGLLHRAANSERETRRAALISSLQLPVLKLASRFGGQLTVTQVAAELGWTLPRAEKVLQSLDDGIRVDSRVTDEGVIVFDFLELPRGHERLSGGDA